MCVGSALMQHCLDCFAFIPVSDEQYSNITEWLLEISFISIILVYQLETDSPVGTHPQCWYINLHVSTAGPALTHRSGHHHLPV